MSVHESIPQVIQQELDAGRQVWTTTGLTDDFEVLGFQAPYVAVIRRSTGVRGSLEFVSSPRFYFGWMES